MNYHPQGEGIESELLTVAQTRRFLNIGHTKLYAMLASGELHAVKMGTKTLIPRAECRRLIDNLPAFRSVAPNAQAA